MATSLIFPLVKACFRRGRGWLPLLAATGLLMAGSAPAAELPAYIATALAHFSAAVPAGWAYSVRVTRGGETSVESFDPGRPAGQQWTLVERNGRPPTPEETDRYQRYRETNNTAAAARASFERGDLDYASAQIVHDDATRATMRCRFRSDAAEPMLTHLELFLQVTKEPAAVETTTLRLASPYSPVIGMRMLALDMETTFSRPTADRPSLPASAISRFHGRILWLWSIDEDSRVVYSDFRRVTPTPAPPATG